MGNEVPELTRRQRATALLKLCWPEAVLSVALTVTTVLVSILLVDREIGKMDTANRFQALSVVLTNARVDINEMRREIQANTEWIVKLQTTDGCRVGNPMREDQR